MMIQILFNHFLTHFTHRCAKIASRPKMLPPIAFFQHWKLLKQLARRPSFYTPHDFTGRERWRRGNQNMDVIFTHDPFQNPNFKSLTRLLDQFPNTQRNISSEDVITIFCHPNEVVLNSEHRVAAISVIHCFTLPKVIIIDALRWLEMKSTRLKTGVLTLFMEIKKTRQIIKTCRVWLYEMMGFGFRLYPSCTLSSLPNFGFEFCVITHKQLLASLSNHKQTFFVGILGDIIRNNHSSDRAHHLLVTVKRQ